MGFKFEISVPQRFYKHVHLSFSEATRACFLSDRSSRHRQYLDAERLSAIKNRIGKNRGIEASTQKKKKIKAPET